MDVVRMRLETAGMLLGGAIGVVLGILLVDWFMPSKSVAAAAEPVNPNCRYLSAREAVASRDVSVSCAPSSIAYARDESILRHEPQFCVVCAKGVCRAFNPNDCW